MGRRWRQAAWRCWAVVLAVSAVVVVPIASAADTKAGAVPGEPCWAMDTHRYRSGLEAGRSYGLRHERRWASDDGGEAERKRHGRRLHREVLGAFRRSPVDQWCSCLLRKEGSLPVEDRQPKTDIHEAQGHLRR